jgi:hypothetical protein
MMLVLFYQVCTSGIEELTERQLYNIGHIDVFWRPENMQFRHFCLVDFNKYKSKACSLFLRTINMMLVLFYQVCTGGIEELTERQLYNIGHMAVLGEKKGTFQTLRCNNFRITKHFFNLKTHLPNHFDL